MKYRRDRRKKERTDSLWRLRVEKVVALLSRPRLWRPAVRGVVASLDHRSTEFGFDHRTVFDVGASRGQFCLFAQDRWPGVRVISFEPILQASEVARSVAGPTAMVHNVALGPVSGRRSLHLSARDDSSSLLPIGRQATEFRGTEEIGSVEVEVQPLSSYLAEPINRPALLKIDVQGSELDVLRSAGEHLTLFDEIYCECSYVQLYDGQALAHEVIAYLSEKGYSLCEIRDGFRGSSGKTLQADFLFRRERT